MNMTILRSTRTIEYDLETDIDHKTRIENVDRDSNDQVTIYGTEENGQLYYIVLDQETIDLLKTI